MPSLVTRPTCPSGCHSRGRELLSLPFLDERVWGFISEYYDGRVPRSAVEGASYTIRQCHGCGGFWQVEVLDADGLGELYETWIDAEASLRKKTNAGIALFAEYAEILTSAASLLERPPHDIELLDYGMGWGHFASVAKAFNYRTHGFELSERRRAYARARGIDVVDELQPGAYGFVNAHQVLEHVPDPCATLAAIVEAMQPEGIVRLSVPDASGMLARLRSSDWRAAKDALHPLEHVNGFTPESLRTLARRFGLVPCRRATSAVGQPAARSLRLRRWLEARIHRRLRPAPRPGTTEYFERPRSRFGS
jgi:2-polyprenyl-3-methyl-5-hydroxy-6-metoxy-1,4-benzoquinol methylase